MRKTENLLISLLHEKEKLQQLNIDSNLKLSQFLWGTLEWVNWLPITSWKLNRIFYKMKYKLYKQAINTQLWFTKPVNKNDSFPLPSLLKFTEWQHDFCFIFPNLFNIIRINDYYIHELKCDFLPYLFNIFRIN